MKQQYVDLDGVRISYYTWGNPGSPAVVLLHGGGLSGATWRGVASVLGQNWFCVAPDLRGHGDSDWENDGDYTLAGYAADLLAMLSAWEIARPHLVGHSLGGQCALYAACHGLGLTSLSLVDVGPRLHEGSGTREINDFLDVDEFPSFDEALDRAQLFRPGRTRDSLSTSLRRTLRETPSGGWTWKWDARRRSNRMDRANDAVNLIPALGNITAPVLSVRGASSDVFTDPLAEELVALIQTAGVPARRVTIPDAGHNVHSDQPSGLAEHLDDFFHQSAADDRSSRAHHEMRHQ